MQNMPGITSESFCFNCILVESTAVLCENQERLSVTRLHQQNSTRPLYWTDSVAQITIQSVVSETPIFFFRYFQHRPRISIHSELAKEKERQTIYSIRDEFLFGASVNRPSVSPFCTC